MESAGLGVILDSSVLIDAERQHLDVANFLKQLADRLGERQMAICAITVAELAFGIYRADTMARRTARREFLDDLKTTVQVYSITSITAEIIGKINAEARARGVVVPLDDLLIGACALERDYAVGTRNLRHFKMIPGLTVVAL